MAFGLSGSHRCGKSTLAKAVAKKLGIHYLDASTTAIMKDTGFNPVAPGASIEARLHAQDYLLRRFMEMAFKAPYPFISDRTPLDYIGYMLGEVTMHNTTTEQGARIEAYVRDCLTATTRIFAGVTVLRPIGVYEVSSDKPPENLAYQWMVQGLIEGAAHRIEDFDQTGSTSAVTILTRELAERINYQVEFIKQVRANERAIKDAYTHH